MTALRAEGCGLPLCGNAYEVSVTGLAVCVICDTISSATYFLVSPLGGDEFCMPPKAAGLSLLRSRILFSDVCRLIV